MTSSAKAGLLESIDLQWVPPYFPSLPPQAIPSMVVVREQMDHALGSGIALYVRRIRTVSHADAAAALSGLRDQLPAGSQFPPAPPARKVAPAVRPPADDDTHDRYFRVSRVSAPAGTAFLRSMIDGLARFHAEMHSDYDPRDAQRFANVSAGFVALLGHIAGIDRARFEHEVTQRVAPATIVAMRRWVIGHQVFAALTQGIIFALQEFEAGARVDDELRQQQALNTAADLLLASGTAFRFTADFAPSQYADVVRPTMMGQNVGEGFSGLLSVDHRQLVAILRRIRPLMSATAIRFRPEHEHLTRALNLVYENHKFVCAQFGGVEKPSLRCPNSSPLPGVEQLQTYQCARVRLLQSHAEGDPVEIDPGATLLRNDDQLLPSQEAFLDSGVLAIPSGS